MHTEFKQILNTTVEKYYHYFHNSSYVFHGHRHYASEVNIILEGKMCVTCADNVYIIEKDSAVIFPPHSFHQSYVMGSDIAEMVVIHFDIYGGLISTDASLYTLSDLSKDLLNILINDLGAETSFQKTFNDNQNKLFDVFLSYLRAAKMHTAYDNSNDATLYKKAVTYMYDHIGDKLSINDFTNTINYCKTTLERVFIKYTGMGCISYFNQLKLYHAKNMILEGKKFGYISDFLGFSSQAHFTKAFKNLYDCTPSQYKKVAHINPMSLRKH